MYIQQFSYFVTIVECDCNLSAAAKKIHISQSGLSKIILSFEQEQQVQLFYRSNGRLTKLTKAGETFYLACLDITRRYSRMLKDIRNEDRQWSGEILLGIPPIITTVLFSNIISSFNMQYPNIRLWLLEVGAEDLQKSFINHQIDFGLLLTPHNIINTPFKEHSIYADKLVAFLSKNNELAKKEFITWGDLNNRPVAIFNESFSINRLLKNKFRETKTSPVISMTCSSWDFLIESVIRSDLITILPNPIQHFVRDTNYAIVPFKDPIIWEVVLLEHKGVNYTEAQKIFLQYVLDHFSVINNKVLLKW